MKRLRIYVDTSVIGGVFDPEFRVWSTGLIEDFRVTRFGLEFGYKPLAIYSPREVTTYEREE